MMEFFQDTLGLNLNVVWFLLVGILFTGYAMLDGFDLGVGILHLFTKTDDERRLMLNSIGPVWDGNEVWLVTGGGALFAAFPNVYATVFSGFYLAFMLLLASLIFRAVAIEFRGKQPQASWRKSWDIGFSIGSIVSALLIGVAIGNIAWGIPLTVVDGQIEYAGGFFNLLHPYALVMGLTTVALFAMHGCIYALMKTEGALHEKLRGWVNKTIVVFVALYAVGAILTLLYVPGMTEKLRATPWFILLVVVNILAIANIPREVSHRRDFSAFISSCVAMLCLMALFGLGMFPNLVLSNPDPANSLHIYNAASSPSTLGIMLVIALIGLPVVLVYTACIYYVFRGKVRLDRHSY
ncbi:MAG: cytochrome d ubiquinol oxidase subunit II [Verrucomicrobiales bacterium]|jgi:cytochrome d ubiquinol oxidase subunit II|nr:cytochrome d ubiquinol oxidase subunit II [Verrucomicrobiales bacterium]